MWDCESGGGNSLWLQQECGSPCLMISIFELTLAMTVDIEGKSCGVGRVVLNYRVSRWLCLFPDWDVVDL